jgi:effector-binding domain-containing protein
VTTLDPDKHVGLDLMFLEPFESKNKVDFDLAPAGDSTKVTWTMTAENGFMGRVMSVFMNMDKMVGPDFEKGLAKLKTMSEADQAAAATQKAKMYGGYEVNTLEHPAQTFVGVRKKIKWSEMHDFFAKSFAAAGEAVGKAGVAPGTPCGVYFLWDEKNQMTDVLAGFPVAADAKGKVKGMASYDAPASKAYQIVYTGGYMGSMKAHEAMSEKIKADNAQQNDVVIEEYVTGPAQEPDSNKWVTNIIYLVK